MGLHGGDPGGATESFPQPLAPAGQGSADIIPFFIFLKKKREKKKKHNSKKTEEKKQKTEKQKKEQKNTILKK